jgi:hypothetical protein
MYNPSSLMFISGSLQVSSEGKRLKHGRQLPQPGFTERKYKCRFVDSSSVHLAKEDAAEGRSTEQVSHHG